VALLLAQTRTTGLNEKLVTFCFGRWCTARIQRASAAKQGALREGIARHSKVLRAKRFLGRCLAAWRLTIQLALIHVEARRRSSRSLAHSRTFILRLRGKITQLTAWLRWSLYFRMKPQVVIPPKTKATMNFCQDPPPLFVKPDQLSKMLTARLPDYTIQTTGTLETTQLQTAQDGRLHCIDASGHGVITSDEFNGFVAVRAPIHEASAPQVFAEEISPPRPLAEEVPPPPPMTLVAPASVGNRSTIASMQAAERHALANQAMRSEAGYRALLEQNRREIREREVPAIPPTVPQSRVVGWGIWAN